MSYDLYCYRAASGVPDAGEAQAFIEATNDAEEAGELKATSSGAKERIVSALIQYNPRLEPFTFDYAKIAEFQKISEEEARARNQHVELNPPDGDLVIQLTVDDDRVFISIPYWYKGSQADDVFPQLSGYLRVIAETSGLLAYDPQTGVAFDPRQTNLSDHTCYDKVVADLPKLATQTKSLPKPWWKFW